MGFEQPLPYSYSKARSAVPRLSADENNLFLESTRSDRWCVGRTEVLGTLCTWSTEAKAESQTRAAGSEGLRRKVRGSRSRSRSSALSDTVLLICCGLRDGRPRAEQEHGCTSRTGRVRGVTQVAPGRLVFMGGRVSANTTDFRV